jgi:hypothetical protein
MVKVNAYSVKQNKDGEKFIALELTGDLELVQSQQTGRFYATVRKCSIPSTFDENVAKEMLGKTLAGKIDRVECVPYEYTIPESGEMVTLNYSWSYVPETETKPVVTKLHVPVDSLEDEFS